jgi:site-specific DNA recombinase
MNRKSISTESTASSVVRCAIYTRKSTEEGLEQEFNSLDAQRESAEAYIKSQQHEGWICLPDRYDDGGFTGGNMERPALRRLMADIEAGRIDCVVVYKVDRLSRSLLDFAQLMAKFDKHQIAFVSVTQQFNTTNSMGRLMLNVLLSFAQFEREIISERTRDKIAATRRKGKWCGGLPPLGYDVVDTKLVLNQTEAEQVRAIFELYVQHEGLIGVVQELDARGWRTKKWTTKKGTTKGGRPYDKNMLYSMLRNMLYLGKLKYKTEIHEGEHEPIISQDVWNRVQHLLLRNGGNGGALIRNRFGAILKGLLYCRSCQCAMSPSHTTRQNKRYRYYVCNNAQKRGRHNCSGASLPANEIERFVLDQIRCIGSDPAVIGETIRQTRMQSTQQIELLTQEKKRLEKDLGSYERSAQAMIGADLSNKDTAWLAELQSRIRPIEQRLSVVRDQLQSLDRELIDESDVTTALGQFDTLWQSLKVAEQNRLIRLLVERVDYDSQAGTIVVTFQSSGIRSLIQQANTGDAA